MSHTFQKMIINNINIPPISITDKKGFIHQSALVYKSDTILGLVEKHACKNTRMNIFSIRTTRKELRHDSFIRNTFLFNVDYRLWSQ